MLRLFLPSLRCGCGDVPRRLRSTVCSRLPSLPLPSARTCFSKFRTTKSSCTMKSNLVWILAALSGFVFALPLPQSSSSTDEASTGGVSDSLSSLNQQYPDPADCVSYGSDGLAADGRDRAGAFELFLLRSSGRLRLPQSRRSFTDVCRAGYDADGYDSDGFGRDGACDRSLLRRFRLVLEFAPALSELTYSSLRLQRRWEEPRRHVFVIVASTRSHTYMSHPSQVSTRRAI